MDKRVILIVMDSVGIGEMPDASEYGDQGSNTLGNISNKVGGLKIPNLINLGIGSITPIPFIEPAINPSANYGKMAIKSKGKDTTTGHWEMTGIILDKGFPTFPEGFPADFIKDFEKRIGRSVLGNEAASGTEITERFGPEHEKTGKPIVYTSADSVFQIAAHEEIIPVDELMKICEIAREMLKDDLLVARVIARPFIGQAGNYTRTKNRHDFSINPVSKTLLDYMVESNKKVTAIGKIKDIFANQGISESFSTKGNFEAVTKTLECIKQDETSLIFTNLVDFDMAYGHRNNVEGYAQALEEFDERIPELLSTLKEKDVLILAADHGCDPTTASTDHSREYVPLLVYGSMLKQGVNLGLRSTLADIGASIANYLDIEVELHGESFLKDIIK
ncbi:MAG: phosphopentomutase [Gracilibacter sp. BRH_c7a]|nr:MAG: phosphopentomutase [Gracilibacter sp. BRH_c7a]